MKLNLRTFPWVLAGVLALVPELSFAASGKAGAVALRQPFGARPFAMGQAYAALGDDIYGMHANPALLSRLKESQASAQIVQSILDIQLGYGAFATPLSPTQALGASLAYLNAGKAEIFDANGNLLSKPTAQQDFIAQLSYSQTFPVFKSPLALGASAKLLKSTIVQDLTATAYALDIGSFYAKPFKGGTASAALVFANLGPGVAYAGGLASGSEADPLPLTGRLAFGYSHKVFKQDTLNAGLQVDRVFPTGLLSQALGVEYNYRGFGAVRLGYRFGEDLTGLTMGLGMVWRGLALDFGVGLMQTFDNVQQFSLAYRFDIPGIKYGRPTLIAPSPLDTMLKEARDHLLAGRFFEADNQLQRIAAFFPSNTESPKIRQDLRRRVDAIIKGGVTAPRYHYAVGYKRAVTGSWNQAALDLKEALRRAPMNQEIDKYLKKLLLKIEEKNRQEELEKQARIGTLFELANQSFERGDSKGALQIIAEILRLGPYQPAESLRKRIWEAGKKKPAAKPTPPPAAKPAPANPAVPAPKVPTPQEAAKAEQLYFEALRNYADNHLETAMEKLRQGRALNPANESIRNTLNQIEKEIRERNKSKKLGGK